MTSPEYADEYSIVKAHIADINSRISTDDISLYADDLFQAGLIGQHGHDNALAITGIAPQGKVASLTSEAMGKMKTLPHLFSGLVTILEKRDKEIASILREEYDNDPLTVDLLLEATYDVTKWRMLGIKLGLKACDLDCLYATYHAEGVDTLKLKMFQEWLRQFPRTSRDDVIKALKGMNEYTAAEKIEKGRPQKSVTVSNVGRGEQLMVDVDQRRSKVSQQAGAGATSRTQLGAGAGGGSTPRVSEDTQGHITESIQMMREKGTLCLNMLHLILHGLPATGKTCAKLKLTGQKLTGRKEAELNKDGVLVYHDNDGAHSTPVAEEITRARVPASATAITRGGEDLPWHLLESLDEETKCMVSRMAELSVKLPKSSKEKKEQSIAPTVQSTISQPEHTAKVFQEKVTRAFKSLPTDTLQDFLKETLIYLIDSGGQPQFQELLPILVSGPSVFLLTFSLATPLDAEYKVVFTDKDGKREVYPTSMKVKDVILQSLASIRCTCSYQTNGAEKVEVKPRVIFMATMRSLVSAEEIEAVDKQLTSLIKPFLELVVFNGRSTIFAVDSFTGDGIADLRKAVLEAANNKVTKTTDGVPDVSPMCQVRLPTTAVALEVLLRYEERGIISLEHCKTLAGDCNIDTDSDELPHILWMLHHSTGSIRYYPDESTLQRYVVTRPQKLYDIPSTLLTHTFAFKRGGDLHRFLKDKLWTRGVFTMETLSELWGEDPVLTPELVVTFLLHLNIIAQLYDIMSGEMQFFMPSALVCAPDDFLVVLDEDSALVCFEGGYSPRGVFSSVLAFLLEQKQEKSKKAGSSIVGKLMSVVAYLRKKHEKQLDLEWCLLTDKGSLCCNQATLVVSVSNKFHLRVKLAVHLKFLEISVKSVFEDDPVTPAQMRHGCDAILRCVSIAALTVSKDLHYNSKASVRNGLFFPCFCNREEHPHEVAMENDAYGMCHGHPTRPKQLWLKKWIKGTPETKQQSQPSTAVCQIATQETQEIVSEPSNTLGIGKLVDVMNALKRVNNWQYLGLQLGILDPTLEQIETENRGNIEECKRKMLRAWLKRQDNVLQVGIPTWSVLQTALRKIGENEVANQIVTC